MQGPYKYLMTGRLIQDCVENLFSQIQSKGDSHPSPVHLRYNLRLISLSQHMHVSRDASCEADDERGRSPEGLLRAPERLGDAAKQGFDPQGKGPTGGVGTLKEQ